MTLVQQGAPAEDVARATRGYRGHRTIKAIKEIRKERTAVVAQPAGPDQTTIHERLRARQVKRWIIEIERRGGEIAIWDKRYGTFLDIVDRDRHTGLVLMGCDGWRYYSQRTPSRHVALRYLCGVDEERDWAVRVASTCQTVEEAYAWMIPSELDTAHVIARQGDIWVLRSRRDTPSGIVGRELAGRASRHSWDAEQRILSHPEHAAVELLHEPAVRFVQNRAISMRRNGGVGRGD